MEPEIGLSILVFHAESIAGAFRSVAPTVEEWDLKNQNLKIACIFAKVGLLRRA
jgi:hypothetical protein